MLCTRIRLNERRFRVLQSQSTISEISNELTSATQKHDGPFVRPCALANVISECNLRSAGIGDGTSLSVDGSREASIVGSSPRSSRSSGRYSLIYNY